MNPRTLAVLVPLVVATAAAAEPIGKVISLEGAAFADRGAGPIVPLAIRSAIHANDRIRTEAASKVQIMLADEAIVMVGENSEMVMDAFVYTPSDRVANETALSLLQGIFRVITAKVTDLNPERFKVKTNMASIGIRGCELGFVLQGDDEEIQIVRMPEGKSILVRNREIRGKELMIAQQGVMVRVGREARLEQRALRAKDILRLRQATTPAVAAVGPSDGAAGSRVPYRGDGTEVAEGVDAADSDVQVENNLPRFLGRDAADAVDALAGDATLNNAGGLALATTETPTAPVAALGRETGADAVSDPGPAADLADVGRLPSGGAGSTPSSPPADDPETGDEQGRRIVVDIIDALPPDPPTPEYPILGEPRSVVGGAGSDWNWGAWARDDRLGEAGGVPDLRTVYGTEVSGNLLPAADYQAIASGGIPRVLTGAGTAAAAVNSAAQGALLTGSSQVRLVLGGNVTPAWQGDFNLSSGADALSFRAHGVLDGSGALNTAASTYSLTAFGQGYDASSLTRNQVTGNLVGNGGNVSGQIGAFDFEHGGAGVTVQGVYGTELR